MGGCRASQPKEQPIPQVEAAPVQPLPDSGFSLEWGPAVVPNSVRAGQPFPAAVLVTNAGDAAWQNPRVSEGRIPVAGAVRLGYRWWKASDHSKPYIDHALARGDLPGPLAPWGTSLLAVEVVAPAEPGQYELQLDLVQEMVTWFEPKGAPRLLVPVHVTP
jgi:hypothetical protein